MKKTFLASALAMALVMGPLAAAAQEEDLTAPDPLALVVDLVVIRPLATLAVVVGLILYVPASIIQQGGGNSLEPIKDVLIRRPHDYAFKRPLGQLNLD